MENRRFDGKIGQKFPLVAEPGSSTENLNNGLQRQLAESGDPLSRIEFKDIIRNHLAFLESGGTGGQWQTLETSGLVIGVYFGANAEEGEQASLMNKNLKGLNLAGVNLSWANCVGVLAESQDFHEADLESSLWTDSFLRGSNFQGANLVGVDFSRADMRDCDFRGANVANGDFENCDLTGSNFEGTKNLQTARFPGACLIDVEY